MMVTEVVSCLQTIFVAADYEHEIFEYLPSFRSSLSMMLAIDILVSLYLFCIFLDRPDSASLLRTLPLLSNTFVFFYCNFV